MSLGLVGAFVVAGISNVNAETRHPYLRCKDTWRSGMTSDNWAYSNAFLEASIRLGSSASVTDFWGNEANKAIPLLVGLVPVQKKQWNWL